MSCNIHMTTPVSIDKRMDELEERLIVLDGMIEIIINDLYVLASMSLTPEQYQRYVIHKTSDRNKLEKKEITSSRKRRRNVI